MKLARVEIVSCKSCMIYSRVRRREKTRRGTCFAMFRKTKKKGRGEERKTEDERKALFRRKKTQRKKKNKAGDDAPLRELLLRAPGRRQAPVLEGRQLVWF